MTELKMDDCALLEAVEEVVNLLSRKNMSNLEAWFALTIAQSVISLDMFCEGGIGDIKYLNIFGVRIRICKRE